MKALNFVAPFFLVAPASCLSSKSTFLSSAPPRPFVSRVPLRNARSRHHHSPQMRVDASDEAFVTCPSCGSDEIVSASRLAQRKSVPIRCSQCKNRFDASVSTAMTATGESLSDVINDIPDDVSSPLTATKLFVRGLSSNVDTPTLKSAFEEFGEVLEAKIIYNHASGVSRGFGFVTLANRKAAIGAMDFLNGSSSKLGSRLKVGEAKE